MRSEGFFGIIIVILILFLGASYGCSAGMRGKSPSSEYTTDRRTL